MSKVYERHGFSNRPDFIRAAEKHAKAELMFWLKQPKELPFRQHAVAKAKHQLKLVQSKLKTM